MKKSFESQSCEGQTIDSCLVKIQHSSMHANCSSAKAVKIWQHIEARPRAFKRAFSASLQPQVRPTLANCRVSRLQRLCDQCISPDGSFDKVFQLLLPFFVFKPEVDEPLTLTRYFSCCCPSHLDKVFQLLLPFLVFKPEVDDPLDLHVLCHQLFLHAPLHILQLLLFPASHPPVGLKQQRRRADASREEELMLRPRTRAIL